MISVKDMSYDELKEQIEICKEALEEYTIGTGDYNYYSSELVVAEKELQLRKVN